MKKLIFMKHHPYLWIVLLLSLTLISCAFPFDLGLAVLQPSATPTLEPSATPQATVQVNTINPATITLSQTNPLDQLLEWKSVEWTLTTARPDGTSRSIKAEVDASGNMHVTMTFQGYALKELPADFYIETMPASSELYIISGKAYQPSEKNPDWAKQPVSESFKQSLSTWLQGSDSPALWLDSLPAGSIKKIGAGKIGEFDALKYRVDGNLDNQKITGTLWEETQNNALVQVELHIPAALTSDSNASGSELIITLDAHRTNGAAITLPSASQEPSQPTPGS